MIRAVLFDAVGTLLWANPGVTDAYFAAGRQFGSALSLAEVAHRFREVWRREDRRVAGGDEWQRETTDQEAERNRWRRVVGSVFHDIADLPAAEELFLHLWHHFSQAKNWSLFDDVPAAWHLLESAGYLVGIASNFDDRLKDICLGLPPLNRCQHLFVSANLGFAKPDRRFFLAIERQLSLPPHEILLIGDDAINDHSGAHRAGWHSLLLDRTRQHDDASSLRTLNQLPAAIDTITSSPPAAAKFANCLTH